MLSFTSQDNMTPLLHSSAKYIGKQMELQACNYLVSQGLQLKTQNYQCKAGEIDLIMMDKNTLVFIEVRHRKHNYYGNGLESITKSKQYKIIKTASHYLQANNLKERLPCRFDAIITKYQSNNKEKNNQQQFLWLKNIF